MMHTRLKRRVLLTALCGALVSLGVPQTSFAQDWPSGPITLMASTPPGGGIDRWSRLLAPYLSEELGVPVVVENVPGGHGILSADRLLRSGGDGSLLVAVTVSQLVDHIEAGRVSFDLDQFSFLNSPAEEYPFLIATAGSRYTSAEELVEALQGGTDIPSMVGSAGAGPGIVMDIFLETLNVPESNYREVTYGGGGPLVVALQGSQVDFGPLPERLLAEIDGIKPLLVFSNERREAHPDVPTAKEFLEGHGKEMPVMNTGLRAIAVPASLREEHPERYDLLVAAMQRVYEREDAIEEFDRAEVGSTWLGPDRTTEDIQRFREEFAPYLGR